MSITSKYPSPERSIKCWGDSLTENSSGGIIFASRWVSQISRSLGRAVSNSGVGGQTSDQIYARMLVDMTPNVFPSVIWAGRNDLATKTAAQIFATLQSMVTWHGTAAPFMILSIIPFADGSEPVGSSTRTKIIDANALIQAAWPDNFLDVLTPLDDNALRSDGLHLNQTGTDLVASLVLAKIENENW